MPAYGINTKMNESLYYFITLFLFNEIFTVTPETNRKEMFYSKKYFKINYHNRAKAFGMLKD